MKNCKVNTSFVYCYFNCDTFKQKDASLLLYMISNSRLIDDMKFYGYGIIKFDEELDKPHRYPEICFGNEDGTPIEWNRRGINCIVFDLPVTSKNTEWDKLFLYHTNSHTGQGQWYGWVAYNSKQKRSSHRFFIDHDNMDLMNALNRFFYHIKISKKNREILRDSRINSHNYITSK